MGKRFFIFLVCFSLLFLSGCSVKKTDTVNNDQNNLKPIVEEKKDQIIESDANNIKKGSSNSKDIIIPTPENLINKCNDVNCLFKNIETCLSSQYSWLDGKNGSSFLVIFGLNNGKCEIMLNKNNFKNNITCFVDKIYWNKDFANKLINYDFSKKSDISNICSEKKLDIKTVNESVELSNDSRTEEQIKADEERDALIEATKDKASN